MSTLLQNNTGMEPRRNRLSRQRQFVSERSLSLSTNHRREVRNDFRAMGANSSNEAGYLLQSGRLQKN